MTSNCVGNHRSLTQCCKLLIFVRLISSKLIKISSYPTGTLLPGHVLIGENLTQVASSLGVKY